MKFCDFLFERRKALGLTQQNIADKLGITNKAVSKWEAGETFPETAQLIPLSEILGCTVDEMLKGMEQPKPSGVEPQRQKSEAISSKKVRYAVWAEIDSVIMMVITATYLCVGFIFNIWHPTWVLFPIGGIACGIVGVIKTAKGDIKDKDDTTDDED